VFVALRSWYLQACVATVASAVLIPSKVDIIIRQGIRPYREQHIMHRNVYRSIVEWKLIYLSLHLKVVKMVRIGPV